MNNLEAWDIIRNRYLDADGEIRGEHLQYVAYHEDDHQILMDGDFSPREAWALGWYLAAPEDFKYLKDAPSGD